MRLFDDSRYLKQTASRRVHLCTLISQPVLTAQSWRGVAPYYLVHKCTLPLLQLAIFFICTLLSLCSISALAAEANNKPLETYQATSASEPARNGFNNDYQEKKWGWLKQLELKHLPALLILGFLGYKASVARWEAIEGKRGVSGFMFRLLIVLVVGIAFGLLGWLPGT